MEGEATRRVATNDNMKYTFSAKGHLMPALLYAGLTACLFAPAFRGDVLAFRDLIRFFYPTRWLAARLWMSGAIPLWNSTGACGSPLLADPGCGAFDPMLPIFALPLPIFFAGTLALAFKYFLAGVLMQRYLSRTGLPPAASFLGGSVYLLAGFNIGSWTHYPWVSALPFLPLALSAVHSGGTAAGRGLAAAAALCFMFWSGAAEPTAFCVALWLAEVFVNSERPVVESVTGIAAFIGFSLFLLLPAFETYLLSNRSGGMGGSESLLYSLSPLQAIGLVLPINFIPSDGGLPPAGLFPFSHPLYFSLYVGASLIPLAVAGASTRRLTWIFLAVAGLVFSTGQYFPGISTLIERFPLMTAFGYPQKFLFFISPALSVLAADGWLILEQISPRRRAVACATAIIIILSISAYGILLSEPNLPVMDAAFLVIGLRSTLTHAAQHGLIALGVSIFLVMALSSRDITPTAVRKIKIAFVALVILDLFVAARAALFFEPAALDTAPALRTRIREDWPRIATMATDYKSGEGVSSFRIHNGLGVNSAAPWMTRHAEEYHSFRSRDFMSWWNDYALEDTAHVMERIGAAGVRYIVADSSGWWREQARLGHSGGVVTARSNDLVLLENPLALSELRFYRGTDPPSRERLMTAGEPVRGKAYLDGRCEATLEPSAPGWLYRAESFYPGWQARVDGGAAPVIAASGFFGQLVRIDNAGRHEVSFVFRPPLFFIGLWSSLAAACLAAGCLLSCHSANLQHRNSNAGDVANWQSDTL